MGMLLYGDLTFDSRVRREARSLALAGFDVVIACLANESTSDDLPPNVSVVVQPIARASVQPGALNPFRAPRRHRASSLVRGASWLVGYGRALRSWGRSATTACGRVDAWHAHDLTGLVALAPRLGGGVPIVYDVHDLLLESGTALKLPSPARRVLQRYEGHLVSDVAAVVTVNRGLAHWTLTQTSAKATQTTIHLLGWSAIHEPTANTESNFALLMSIYVMTPTVPSSAISMTRLSSRSRAFPRLRSKGMPSTSKEAVIFFGRKKSYWDRLFKIPQELLSGASWPNLVEQGLSRYPHPTTSMADYLRCPVCSSLAFVHLRTEENTYPDGIDNLDEWTTSFEIALCLGTPSRRCDMFAIHGSEWLWNVRASPSKPVSG